MKTLIKILCLSVLWFSCESSTESQNIYGCTISYACNFNPDANIFDGSCILSEDCNNIDDGDNEEIPIEDDGHTDADGMEIVLMTDGEEGLFYRECDGAIIQNEFQSGISSGNEWDFTVHFLDNECDELEHDDDDHDGHDDHGDDEPYLEITGYDTSIISITVGGHDNYGDEEHCYDFTTEVECDEHDECEWHADDMACEDGDHDDHDDHHEEHGYTFELETLAPGETTFEVRLMNQGHSDYISSTITIVVE